MNGRAANTVPAGMALTSALPGQSLRLLGVNGGRGLQGHLNAMGLIPGTPLEVISNTMHGPVVVAARHTRLILGAGMAQRIFVTAA